MAAVGGEGQGEVFSGQFLGGRAAQERDRQHPVKLDRAGILTQVLDRPAEQVTQCGGRILPG
ncbi:hypothetical protein, partial [Nonomuraea turcica]|uniref:hypothetical protein n=1 Tax=Nonomuraea sp. G32 TaxID=3067274 RepID=UPI00273C8BA0